MMEEMSAARVVARSGDTGGSATSPQAAGGDGLRVATLRPRRTLARSVGLTLAALAFPLIAVDLWALQPRGDLGIVTAVVAVLLGCAVIAWRRYRRTEVLMSELGIVERGFFGQVQSIAGRDIAGVIRLELYRGATLDTTRQLFVVDGRGRCLFRMRGTFWDTTTMDRVAGVLGVEEVVRPEPATLAELRASDPELLYWFERLPFAHVAAAHDRDRDDRASAAGAGAGDR